MAIIQLLLEFFLEPQKRQSLTIGMILGYILLIAAAILALFFLFQGLIPVIGYLPSGAVICVILITAGIVLIYRNQRKQRIAPQSMDLLLNKAEHMLAKAEVDLQKSLSDNAPRILFLSIVAGFILSQFTGDDPDKDK